MKRFLSALCLLVFLGAAACANQTNSLVVSPRSQVLKKGGTFRAGDWVYVLRIRNAGTRSEGSEGRLFYRQQELTAPGELQDYYDTPLGRFRHTGIEPGQERYLWDDTGWMRMEESRQDSRGTEIPWPEKSAL